MEMVTEFEKFLLHRYNVHAFFLSSMNHLIMFSLRIAIEKFELIITWLSKVQKINDIP